MKAQKWVFAILFVLPTLSPSVFAARIEGQAAAAEVAVEVDDIFAEWTSEGFVRQASFLGLRDDKRPEEVVREG